MTARFAHRYFVEVPEGKWEGTCSWLQQSSILGWILHGGDKLGGTPGGYSFRNGEDAVVFRLRFGL